jgi:hypothetical protein
MPTKKHKLSDRQEPDFMLFGISSVDNDYHLSWTLNNDLGMKLVKHEDLEVFHKRLEGKQEFSQFSYFDENSLNHYRLLSNRSENGYLLEELPNVDYLLQVSGDVDSGFSDHLLKQLNGLESIRLAFTIETAGLKSAGKLML